jgi:uncharacterized LabA/DUF88 family protein
MTQGGDGVETTVGVFIDWQNSFHCAREAFGPGTNGNVNPLLLANLLSADRLPAQGRGRLALAHMHAGMASQARDHRTYAANRRQFQKWQASAPHLVKVLPRTLAYRAGRAEEKGIDVALAIDLVRCALFEGHCSVAILLSADTDLLPAVELIAERRGPEAIEVAAWKGRCPSPAALSISGATLRKHLLDERFYRKVQDLTDYNLAPRRR